MSKIPPSKDGTLEALDFILNIIREHDKDLEKITDKLASIAKKGEERGELKVRLSKMENDLDALQRDVEKLTKSLLVSTKKS